jgi:peptidoglycan/xylan/chitin deacetylase (PgdA/CDA1 family)
VDHTDRPVARDAPPCIGRQRQRPAEQPRPHADLDGEPQLDDALVEDERPRDEIIGRCAGRRAREHQRSRQQRSHARTLTRALALAAAALTAACHDEIGAVDGAFYNGDGRRVHCAINLDTAANNRIASIDSGLDRARDRGEVVELYAHNPGGTVPLPKLEYVLAGARDRGLSFMTYADFARERDTAPGVALSFDDHSVGAWLAARPLFDKYGARITFFVSRYAALTDAERAGLAELAGDGHDIEAHSVRHLRAPDYVENHGLAAYLRDEVDPSIEVMRNDGYEVHAYAYPFGARTDEIDRAIARRVPVLRSVAFTYTLVDDPCPR